MVSPHRLQAAMEYIITYGWVVLVISLGVATLYALGVFNSTPFASSVCSMQSGFTCQHAVLASNGLLTFSLVQQTADPVSITAIACDNNQSLIHKETITPHVYLVPSENATFSATCWQYSAAFFGQSGTLYNGYLLVSYTDLATDFNYTTVGTVALKVS